MRKILLALIAFPFLNGMSQVSQLRSVEAWAVADPVNEEISLNWVNESYHTGCEVFRRDYMNSNGWGQALDTLATGVSTWVDSNVTKGEQYEYRIACNTTEPDPLINHRINIIAVSYLLAGIETEVIHLRGNLALVIEQTIADSLQNDLELLASDLSGDGWKVHRIFIHRDSSYIDLKNELLGLNSSLNNGLQSIYLFGNVPVPYSGDFKASTILPPDIKEPDHNGAWAADVYYGVVNGTWRDNVTNVSGILREANRNRPGDDKFDQIELPGLAEIQVGRVDLSDMTDFDKTEIELLRQYIQKSHNYRHGITETYEISLIDDNLQTFREGFSTAAWTNFSAMFGPDNIRTSDYFSTLNDSSFLMAYGCGAGTYTSCNGIGITEDFKTNNGAVFNFLFGSEFGDWDIENNFLRAPLAAEKLGLTNAWSGRPLWQAHPMALGRTVGEICMLTQNNTDQMNDYMGGSFLNLIHIALMGDPSLRLHVVKPPSDVIINKLNNNTQVELEWTASPDSQVVGYYVYRGREANGMFDLLNNTPLVNLSFIDANPLPGESYYLIKALKLEESASGTYFNLSQGVRGFVDSIQGNMAAVKTPAKERFKVYPNPASDVVYVHTTINDEPLEIVDMAGKTLVHSYPRARQNTSLNVSHLPQGIYILKQGTINKKLVITH